MQNRKEELTEFVETIKNKVHDWWVSSNRKLWTTRIFVYGFLLLLVIFVGAVTFAHFNLFHTDVTSARYMLSALVQSQAAIVAIVITLTLIAVQLTASAYSPRVIRIFRNNPDMWLLLGCYGVSIFYGFIVLKLVEGAGDEAVSQSAIWSLGWISISFESCVSLAYWLGAFTFVALFLYMINIIDLLRPENIIKRLAIEITKENVSKFIESVEENEKDRKKPVEKDPILPIMDIIHGAVMKYDPETVRVGLKAVTDQMIEIIGPDDEEKISKHFCDHLKLVSRSAISREDVESTVEVIDNLKNFGKSTAEKRLEYAAKPAAKSIEGVGAFAARKELEYVACQAAKSLGDVGSVAVENELESTTILIVEALKRIGKIAAEKVFEDVVDQVVESLGLVGEAAAEKKLDRATRQAAQCLGLVGTFAATKEFKNATRDAALYLGLIGKSAAKKGLEIATQWAAKCLAELTILSEETATQAVRKCEYELENEDYEPFQKFVEMYEQELEKLRAGK
jgi:hypothetical protein